MPDQQTAPAPKAASNNIRRELALIPLGVALNTALGMIVHALKLPVYLDAVGTIVITLIVGLRAGIICGVLSACVGGLLFYPMLPFFSGTQAAIAIYAHLIARARWFKSLPLTIVAGIGLGIVAATVSAPVAASINGGVTGSGASLITAYLLKAGKGLYQSVLLSGFSCEPIDKTAQCLLATWLLKGMPQKLLRQFNSPALERNGFVKP